MLILSLWNLFLDEAQEAEAIQVLNAIYEMNEQQPLSPDSSAKIAHGLAMLAFILHDIEKVCNSLHVHKIHYFFNLDQLAFTNA